MGWVQPSILGLLIWVFLPFTGPPSRNWVKQAYWVLLCWVLGHFSQEFHSVPLTGAQTHLSSSARATLFGKCLVLTFPCPHRVLSGRLYSDDPLYSSTQRQEEERQGWWWWWWRWCKWISWRMKLFWEKLVFLKGVVCNKMILKSTAGFRNLD